MTQTTEFKPTSTVVMACGCEADYLDREGKPFCSECLQDKPEEATRPLTPFQAALLYADKRHEQSQIILEKSLIVAEREWYMDFIKNAMLKTLANEIDGKGFPAYISLDQQYTELHSRLQDMEEYQNAAKQIETLKTEIRSHSIDEMLYADRIRIYTAFAPGLVHGMLPTFTLMPRVESR